MDIMDTLPAASLKRRLLSATVVMLLLSTCRTVAQQLCEHCNCQISSSEETQAIYSMGLICNTGTITWFGGSGAVRLELTPFVRGDFRTCFVIESENIHVKISQENPHVSKAKNYRLKAHEERTLKLDHLVTSKLKSNEFCVSSKSGDPLLLYIESVRTPDVIGVAKVVFHYDVEKLDSMVLVDPMEECRPCTKEEILDAYCSMDFVVIGSMADVHHNEVSDKTDVTLNVRQIILQREQNFFRRVRRSDPHLTGHVTVPRKCGIRKGDGEFLMTGRARLGQLALKCAPYLQEWRQIQHEVECSHG
ncbi:meteorin-like protein [Aplysia californica]|uniref:Meteorin-like protein n=1 Tax=Aplysia californica TaxID=6500 RepID=A0ABM0JVC3_APLCA|nr:meteorin-like protein [Aplysia californica]